MKDGLEFTRLVKLFFSFLESEFGFKKSKETINGNAFYDVEYQAPNKVISISYENIEDYLQVIIFILENGKLPDFDDKTKTLHLSELNKAIITQADIGEINLNSEYFSGFKVKVPLERKLLKEAKELRLCLKHFNSFLRQ